MTISNHPKVAAQIVRVLNDEDVQIARQAGHHRQQHSKSGGVVNEVRCLYLDINTIAESLSSADGDEERYPIQPRGASPHLVTYF